MMADPFEYDVFLSFSSADEEIVKPIWQELCSNGLRVFWSDATLRKEVGNSWFEVIEKSLDRSKHMLLVCSDNSMNSKWVQREYRAFFNFISPNSRRLIPILTRGYEASRLPLFLRELQVGKIDDPDFIQEVISLLGGVNIEKLRNENRLLKERVSSLLNDNNNLKAVTVSKQKYDLLSIEYISMQQQVNKLSDENVKLKRDVDDLTRKMRERRGYYTSETTLYVDNLSDSTDDGKLFSMFSKVGKVVAAWVNKNGSGFVEMESIDDAKHAIHVLNGMYHGGRRLNVKFSQLREYSSK